MWGGGGWGESLALKQRSTSSPLWTIYFIILYEYVPNFTAIFYHCTDVVVQMLHYMIYANAFLLVH